jgi:hypothetical protein
MKLLRYLPLLLASCSSSGPVATNLDDSAGILVVKAPQNFRSPLEELDSVREALSQIDDQLSFRYQAFLQKEDEIVSALEETQAEMINRGGIDLIPGESYSFKVESFCVYPGAYRPLSGDGLRVGNMSGKASEWLPQLLEKLPIVDVPQDRIQLLIWKLLSGAHYDELNNDDQDVLGLFFNDGFTRFGSSGLNHLGSKVFDSVAPGNLLGAIDDFSSIKDEVFRFQGDFKKLESLLAPESARVKPLPVGWMQMDGYLMRLTSNGYTEVQVDIYVPEDDQNRKPQSKKLFKLSDLVALPAVGQRLAISHKMNIPQRTNNDNYCNKIRSFKPKNCSEVSDKVRNKILEFANPEHFLKTRYASPPSETKKIEEETDCSHFVQQIYHRSGLDYPYIPTSAYRCLSIISEVKKEDILPGDIILYRGHVGIYSKDKKVISATLGGTNRRSMLEPSDPNFVPSITNLPIDQAYNGEWKALRWECP